MKGCADAAKRLLRCRLKISVYQCKHQPHSHGFSSAPSQFCHIMVNGDYRPMHHSIIACHLAFLMLLDLAIRVSPLSSSLRTCAHSLTIDQARCLDRIMA